MPMGSELTVIAVPALLVATVNGVTVASPKLATYPLAPFGVIATATGVSPVGTPPTAGLVAVLTAIKSVESWSEM